MNVALLALTMFATTLMEQARVDEPIEASVPPRAIRDWNSFEFLPQPDENAAIEVRANEAPPDVDGRVDVFEFHQGRWLWQTASRYSSHLTLPVADVRRAILIRFRRTPYYLWSEVDARSSMAVRLSKFRNLDVEAPPGYGDLFLYAPGEVRPREAGRETRFHFVPLKPVLVCAVRESDARCQQIAAGATRSAITESAVARARVFGSVREGDQFIGLASGNVALRPKGIPLDEQMAGSWVALAPRNRAQRWEEIVIDRTATEFTLVRLEGARLEPPPAFTDLASEHARGVIVRPWTDSDKHPFTDRNSLLLIFPADGGEVSSKIPLARVSLAGDGLFHAESLGSGSYILQLLLSSASPSRLRAEAIAQVPLDIVFSRGAIVKGRIVLGSGGSADEAVAIEVDADTTFEDALRSPELMERFRPATADGSGKFQISIGTPGKYRLFARWGTATAEVSFELPNTVDDVDLGDIALSRGVTFHGTIGGCRGGEIVFVPVPNLSRPLRIGSVESRYAPIGSGGRFVIEGLTAGLWSALARCGGTINALLPAVVSIPETGEMALQFEVGELISAAPGR